MENHYQISLLNKITINLKESLIFSWVVSIGAYVAPGNILLKYFLQCQVYVTISSLCDKTNKNHMGK